MPKTLKLRSTFIALSCSLLFAASAVANDLKRFEVPAGDLAAALDTLAKQSGVEILYQTERVKGLRTKGVTGNLTAQDAVIKLLEGTPLKLKTDASGAMLVAPPPVAPTASVNADAGARKLQLTQVSPSTWTGKGGESSSRMRDAEGEQGDPSSPQSVRTDEDASLKDEVTVIGSHIRGAKVSPASPVTTYTRDDIDRSGAGSVEEFTRKIPQNFGLIGEGSALATGGNRQAAQNFQFGSGINLRGLGSGSTLVLLNGHRLAPAGSDGSFVDVSMIPLAALNRVEVMTDGASAIYGADAVAGVVNFSLRDDYEGAETKLRYADTTRGGALERGLSQTLGSAWSSGAAMLVYDYADQGGLRSTERSFVPSQGGSILILPQQERHSAIMTGHQDIGSSTRIFGHALYSKRDFETEANQILSSANQTRTVGDTRQFGGLVGVGQSFGAWQGEVTGSYAKSEGFSRIVGISNGFPVNNVLGADADLLSAEVSVSGPLLELPAGQIKMSFGGGYRRESFDDRSVRITNVGTDLERDVSSGFAEFLIPLVGARNARPGLKRLEVSLAGRVDHYDDIGSSTNPKAGLVWSPVSGLNLRGSYSRAFRAPPLSQLSTGGEAAAITRLRSPPVTGPFVVTMIRQSTGNPDLEPERSKSYTAGFDLTPAAIPSLQLSGTYFRIDYEDRIDRAPVVGSLATLFSQLNTLGAFVDTTPDLAVVQGVFDNAASLSNPLRFTPAGVQAVFDWRVQNMATSKASGVELHAQYRYDMAGTQLDFSLAGDYLLDLEYRPVDNAAAVDLVNKIFNPMDFRIRGGAALARGEWGAALFLSYSDGYENNLVTPQARVSSFTTVDLQLSYQAPLSAPEVLQGMQISLTGQNLFDKDPPAVPSADNEFTNFGYDPTNASARGRILSLQLVKRW